MITAIISFPSQTPPISPPQTTETAAAVAAAVLYLVCCNNGIEVLPLGCGVLLGVLGYLVCIVQRILLSIPSFSP